MNCHKAINKYDDGPLWNGADGTKEIQKIYAAIGWDPERMRFDENAKTKPVEWVRIHNLPDHVYFNHAQHVNVISLRNVKHVTEPLKRWMLFNSTPHYQWVGV